MSGIKSLQFFLGVIAAEEALDRARQMLRSPGITRVDGAAVAARNKTLDKVDAALTTLRAALARGDGWQEIESAKPDVLYLWSGREGDGDTVVYRLGENLHHHAAEGAEFQPEFYLDFSPAPLRAKEAFA